MTDPLADLPPGQWWLAPPGHIFRAYYRCLRQCYGMGAFEAYCVAQINRAAYPEFFRDPLGTIRAGIARSPVHKNRA